MALVYVPGEEIAPGELVSAMLAFIRSITGVYVWVRRGGDGVDKEETDEISCVVRHAEDE